MGAIPPSGSDNILIIAAVSVLVVFEVFKALWPILRPSEPKESACAAGRGNIAALETKMDAFFSEFRQETLRFQGQCAETLRMASTACDQNGKQFEILRESLKRIDDLHEWHNVTDSDTGAKIWYVQKALLEGVKATAEATVTQARLIEEIRGLIQQFLAVQQELMNRAGK